LLEGEGSCWRERGVVGGRGELLEGEGKCAVICG